MYSTLYSAESLPCRGKHEPEQSSFGYFTRQCSLEALQAAMKSKGTGPWTPDGTVAPFTKIIHFRQQGFSRPSRRQELKTHLDFLRTHRHRSSWESKVSLYQMIAEPLHTWFTWYSATKEWQYCIVHSKCSIQGPDIGSPTGTQLRPIVHWLVAY